MLQTENQDSEIQAAGIQAEKYLAERINRGLRKSGSQEIICEFTKNPAYLHQFYIVRSQVIGRTWGWSLPPEEDAYDKGSHIMVVRKGNQVIGGGRIVIRSPRLQRPLLLESEDFSLIDALPELGLANKKYCELSRFVLLEEYQQSLLSLEMFYRMYKKYCALGIDYGFAGVAAPSVRVYRRFCSSLGLNYTVRDDIVLPDRPHYEGLPMKLVMFDDVGVADKAEATYSKINKLAKTY